jgi:hypothetical protein
MALALLRKNNDVSLATFIAEGRVWTLRPIRIESEPSSHGHSIQFYSSSLIHLSLSAHRLLKKPYTIEQTCGAILQFVIHEWAMHKQVIMPQVWNCTWSKNLLKMFGFRNVDKFQPYNIRNTPPSPQSRYHKSHTAAHS